MRFKIFRFEINVKRKDRESEKERGQGPEFEFLKKESAFERLSPLKLNPIISVALAGFGLWLLMTLISGENVFAKPAPDGYAAENVVEMFRDYSKLWVEKIRKYALSLLLWMAGIQFTITAIRGVMSQYDLAEYMLELMKTMFMVGLFYALLQHSEWIMDFVNSFIKIGEEAARSAGGTGNMTPATIFSHGLNLFLKTLKSANVFNPIDSLVLVVCGFGFLACYTMIAITIVAIMFEMYVGLHAGFILLAFGGMEATRQIAINYIQYMISIGVKLMVLTLIVNLGINFLTNLMADFGKFSIRDYGVLLACSFLMWGIVQRVPQMIQGLFQGISMGGAANVRMASMAAGAVAFGAAKFLRSQAGQNLMKFVGGSIAKSMKDIGQTLGDSFGLTKQPKIRNPFPKT